jgi:hypothetical protein
MQIRVQYYGRETATYHLHRHDRSVSQLHMIISIIYQKQAFNLPHVSAGFCLGLTSTLKTEVIFSYEISGSLSTIYVICALYFL